MREPMNGTVSALAAASIACCCVGACGAQATSRPEPSLERPRSGFSQGARIDSVVNAVMRARDVPGAAVAVLHGDTLVFARGYGVADRERRTPVTERTVFQLASATKPFTAMAVLMLADEGHIDLDAPAARYLGWLRERDPIVTIRQLLTHTAGVPADVRRANVDEFPIDEFRRRFLAAAPASAPGTRWEYANAGYTLLALVVEEVTGAPFGDFLHSRIFAPLGMAHTGYRVPARRDAEHARGYDWVEGRLQPAPHVFSGWGNSGVESSVADLARWAAVLDRGALLGPWGYRMMFTPARLADGRPAAFGFRDDPAASYGFGWFLTRYRGRVEQSHGGAVAGFSSIVIRLPESRTTIIVLSNGKDRGDRRAQAETIARATLDVLLGSSRSVPTLP
jgi:D-alanyl-D-alanine carboxypeptidase